MSTVTIETASVDAAKSTKTQSQPAPVSTQRIHYLDNLRALAMLLGVLLHAGFAYADPAQAIWIATDSQSSVTIDASIWFIHLFRMGLFFLLSGYFAKLVIEKKGVGKFFLGRSLRIALPFVIFYPFLLVSMTVVFGFALSYLKEPLGLMGKIAEVAELPNPPDPPLPTTMHLWFLYYLFAFTILAAIFARFSLISLDRLFPSSKLALLWPLVLVPAVVRAGVPLPAPDSFIPDWWPFLFYGLFYLGGWRLYGREAALESLRPYVWHITVACVALFLPYYILMPVLDSSVFTEVAKPTVVWKVVVEAILTAYLSVLLSLVSLLLAQRFLASRKSWLAFIADSSYWVYLIHLPIVLFLQTLLVPFPWPLWIKFIAVLTGTMLPCLITYVVFVRYTPLGWLLHGKRSFP